MRRHAAPAALAALAAALLTSVSAASPVPYLQAAAAKQRHVVVTFTLGELVPGRIVVAVRRETTASGKFVAANVRLDEQLRARKTATGYRAQTRRRLRPGHYYVQVSGVVLALDCTPHKPCKENWSNIRPVRIRRS